MNHDELVLITCRICVMDIIMTSCYAIKSTLNFGKFGAPCLYNFLQIILHVFEIQSFLNYHRKKNNVQETESFCFMRLCYLVTQSAFTCSKLTIRTLEQGVKYVQS